MNAVVRFFRRNVRRGIPALLVVILLVWGYFRYASPTTVAFVNFRDFQFSDYQSANENPFIRFERIGLDDEDATDLSKYPVILMFGRGINFTQDFIDRIRRAGERGSKIYVLAAGSNELNLSNLTEEEKQTFSEYIRYGGPTNICSLLNYARRNFDGKRLFVGAIQDPVEIHDNGFFHYLKEETFSDVDAYLSFYKENELYKPDGANVCMLTTFSGPRSANRIFVDDMTKSLERKGFNVFPLAGYRDRLPRLEAVKPDVVLYFAMARLFLDREIGTIDWFREKNIPLLLPLRVLRPYDEWIKSQQGMVGGRLSAFISMPELDGAIDPYTVSAQFKNEQDLYVNKGIERRIETFAERVSKWVRLKRLNNADKKAAIFYYKGPGLNAMTASGLEVAPSLLNLLRAMKDDGYDTGPLPESEEEFSDLIQSYGAVFNPYAQGAIANFVSDASPELIPVERFDRWCKQNLEPDLYQTLVERYGPPPGDYMARHTDDESYLAIPRVQFGNVVLIPQSMPGIGSDAVQMVHGTNAAPPYPYIAAYFWARFGFEADALVHFGTHGSLEFTPFKQNALSQYDWPDILIGDSPHLYVYVINNIGEATIAKRRSYAVIASHLTPPFMEAGSYDRFPALHQKFHEYMDVENPALKDQYRESIQALCEELGLNKDLDLDDEPGAYSEETLTRIHNYLHELEQEKITRGLYTLTVPYSATEALETTRLMNVDAVAYGLKRLEESKEPSVSENLSAHEFDVRFRQKALGTIDSVLIGGASPDSFFSREDLDRLKRNQANEQSKGRSRMGMMGAMAGRGRSSSESTSAAAGRGGRPSESMRASTEQKEKPNEPTDSLDEALKGQIAKAIGEPGVKKFLLSLEDAGRLREIGMKVMGGGIAEDDPLRPILENQDVRKILFAMRRDAQRQAILKWIEKPDEASTKDKPSDEMQKTDEPVQDDSLRSLQSFHRSLTSLQKHNRSLIESTTCEIQAFLNGLDGGYISPSSGGDPIANPDSVPTGRNMFSINPENTPTQESWNVGKQMAESLIAQKLKKSGEYPKKVVFSLWGGEFIRTRGIDVAQILYLVGCEPVWDSRGRVQDVELIPYDRLKRPRIDVVVQTSGQFRDIAASRMFLIDRAIHLAAQAEDTEEANNYILQGNAAAEKVLIERGASPLEARELSSARIFGGLNGNYGTGITGFVENSDSWEERDEIAKLYLNNMNAVYTEDHWCESYSGALEGALQNADTIVHGRSSHVWGPLSLDHVYEFMGGVNAAVARVTGKEPDAFFGDYRNVRNAKVQNAKEAIWVETRTTLYNPKYITALQEGGASSAATFAETFRNTFAWNALKPDVIDDELWDGLYEVYVQDKYQLGLKEFFADKNPYAFQEMTAVMLETHRKGLWEASPEQVKTLAKLHAEFVRDHKAGCSGFVCDNAKLKGAIAEQLDASMRETYESEIEKVREAGAEETDPGVVLEKEKIVLSDVSEFVAQNRAAVLIAIGLTVAFFILLAIGKRRK